MKQLPLNNPILKQSETNFWQNLPHGFLCLAPMEDVTDTVFREIVMQVSHPERLHVVFTEFASTDGLCHEKSRENTLKRLFINQSELTLLHQKNIKLVAQIWGSDPEKFYKAARFISHNYPFDGIDINMGCPIKKIIKKQCCSALIQYPILAKEIIKATQEGTSLPISVKTRIGFNTIVTESWISTLLETNPAAITIHGRTQKMMSKGIANWNELKKAVHIRNDKNYPTRIIGNGDIVNMRQAKENMLETGVDGLMIGRGIFHNPWIFNHSPIELSAHEKLNLLMTHVEKFTDTWKGKKSFNLLKRFFKIYCNSFQGAVQLRSLLMECNNRDDVQKELANFVHQSISIDEVCVSDC